MTSLRPRIPILVPTALAALAAASGCGGQSQPEQARPASEAGPTADQAGKEEGARGDDGGVSQSNSVKQSTKDGSASQSSSTVQRSGSGSSSVSQSTSSSGGVQTISGTGKTTVSFNVEKASRLSWTNAEGKRFSARGAGLSIDSREGRGEVSLDAGRYDDVKVRGSTWTIVIRPR